MSFSTILIDAPCGATFIILTHVVQYMPLKAKAEPKSDSTLTPFEAESGVEVYCTSCGEPMVVVQSHKREGGIVVIRHFRHKADRCSNGGGAGGGGGEGDPHLRAKAIAVETLSEFYPDGNAVFERTFELSGQFKNGTRIGDAVVEFDTPHEKFGSGIVIEVQDKHEDKNVLATTRAYLDNGYSVCWLSLNDFGKYSLKYAKGEFESLLKNEFSDGETVFDANLNRDGTVPNKGMYPLVASTWPHSIEVAKETRPRVTSGWDYSAYKHDDEGRLLLNAENEVYLDLHAMPSRNLTMPAEFYEDLAQRYFRETSWDDLFEPYTWHSRQVKKQWGEMASLDEMEVKLPLEKWMAADDLLMVTGESAETVFGSNWRFSGNVRFADSASCETAFVSTDCFKEHDTDYVESAEKVSIDSGDESKAIKDVDFYVPASIEWSAAPWNTRFPGTLEEPIEWSAAPWITRFPGTLEEPIGGDLARSETISRGEIPINYWLSEHGVPDTVERQLRVAFNSGRRNQVENEKDKREAMERVPRIIDYNTGGPQPDAIKERSLFTIACSHANISTDAVEWALGRLIDQGKIESPEKKRYSLAE